MKLSDAGVDMIVSFEGLHRKIGDGRYMAYRCPAGVWTIYAGCTEGVREGMIWTEAEGKAAFRKELTKHEAAVMRLVSVDLNQNQFDALVSFSYNVGSGALSKSTLLRKLNAGDYPGAQAEFMKWTKGGGKQLRGLAIRRAKEAALFAERVEEDEPEPLPQALDAPKEPMKPGTKVAIASSISGGGTAIVSSPPQIVTDTVGNVGAWQGIGKTVSGLASVFIQYPLLMGGVFIVAASVIFWPQITRIIGREA